MNNKQVAAFFDIDGTFYRDSLLIEHFKRLIKYEIISPSVWHDKVKHTFNNWDKRQGNYDDYLNEVSQTYAKYLTGLSFDDIDYIAKQVIRTKADRVYRFTRERIEWHLAEGHHVIFISGSPDFLVEKMAEKYNATDCRGSHYLFNPDGTFSGEISPMWDSRNKLKTISEMVGKYDLDLSKSFAYGDTQGDFTMLESVGNPVLINPSSELLQSVYDSDKILKNAWLAIERKDVIYFSQMKTKSLQINP